MCMKKHLYIVALALAGLFVSCRDKAPVDPAEGDFKKGGTVLEPTEQQTKVENTVIAAVDAVNPQDFRQLIDLTVYFVEEYCNENVDFSEIEEALGQKIENAVTVDEQVYSDTKESYSAAYFETLMLQFSQLCGKIEANSTKWTYEPSDRLTINFKDRDGRPCVIEATGKGELGYVEVYSSYEYFSAFAYDANGDGIPDYDYYTLESYYSVKVNLPEEFKYVVKEDGTELMKAAYEFKTNIAQISDEAELDKLYCDGNAVFEVAGYKFELKKAFLDVHTLEITSAISKGEQIIFSEKVAVSDFTLNLNEEIGFEGGKFEAKWNLLGEVQLYCEVPRMDEFAKLLDEGVQGDSEADIQAYLDRLNSAYKVELHFDNTAAVQGHLEFRLFVFDDAVAVLPVIVFNDGTSYAIEDYFNGEMLERISVRIQQLVAQFEAITTY